MELSARKRVSGILVLAIGMLLIGCGGTANPAAAPRPAEPTTPAAASAATATVPAIQGTLTVFTAASLTEAFKEIGAAVEAAHPGTRVTFNFAGSPALRAQLREGARADVFASADEPNLRGAQRDGTIASDPRIFVRNKLVAITPAQSRADLATLPDLARPGLKLVLAQQDVPAGNYARQALDKMSLDAAFGGDFSQKVLANLVSEEASVRQVVSKVQLGEADAGIVYSSDITPAVRPQVKVIEIPDQFNVIASYPIAVVTGAANPEGARAFIDYVLAPAGQATLQKHGFIPIGPTSAVVPDGRRDLAEAGRAAR